MMRKAGLAILLIGLLLVCTQCTTEKWQPAEVPSSTPWTADVTPENAWPEYPRPQLVREHWLNLNGLWDYAILPRETVRPQQWSGKILVPYPVESALSGVGQRVSAAERLWYQREIKIPAEWRQQRVMLNFEAVDWECIVWVNGREVGRHRGGYDPFSFDITAALTDAKKQNVLITVWDPTETGAQPRGNQMTEPDSTGHSSVTGIWQTVWLEPVPDAFIHSVKIEPDLDNEQIQLMVVGTAAASMCQAKVAIFAQDSLVTEQIIHPNRKQRIAIPKPHLWHPNDPFLYQMKIQLDDNGTIVDSATSYFGMRDIRLGETPDGLTRILLNQKFEFQLGVADAGYWPDGIYTAPTDAAIQYDIKTLKKFSFNLLHQTDKIESRRFYYWCDQTGVLVWQEMPGSAGREFLSAQAAMQYEYELRQLLLSRFNHPSIVMWRSCLGNVSEIEAGRIEAFIHSVDSTRIINIAGSESWSGAGDIRESRNWPNSVLPTMTDSTAAVTVGFEGTSMPINGQEVHADDWLNQYDRLIKTVPPLIENGFSGAVCGQLVDGMTAKTGLLTVDRKLKKLAPDSIRAMLGKYLVE